MQHCNRSYRICHQYCNTI